MKIAHIAYFGRYGKITGIVEAVTNMVDSQRKLGHDVRTYIPFEHPLQDGENVYYIKSFGYLAGSIREFKPDIVVFDGFYDKYQIRLSFLLKFLSIPYIIVFHGGASSDNAKKNWIKKKVANILFFNRFVRWANRVVYLSENEKSRSIFLNTNKRSSILPNGVKIDKDISYKGYSGKLKILFLSRLDWKGKGLDVLCDAIRMLYEGGYSNKVEFFFFGTKESVDCDKLFVFGEMTKYCGYVSGDEKKEAFKSSDIFILPSRSEGMPVAVLEDLSFGMPCIVTPETNMATLIEDNECGWVVYLSAKDIFNTIVNAIDTFPSKCQLYFDNCIDTASQFDWDFLAEKSIEIYKKTINNE